MLRETWAATAISRLTFAAALLMFAAALFASASAGAQTAPQGAAPRPSTLGADKDNPLSKTNSSALTIVTGAYDSTTARVIGELASKLGADDDLRVMPVSGRGSIQNIYDLLTLRSVDLAIVQSDVLAYFQRSNSVPGLENQIQYVTKLYSEEFHILSRMQYLCLAELDGRRVNFGPKGGGASITAEAVFESQKINVLPLYLDQTEALEKLKTGEIDATVYVDGKPSRIFDHIRYTDRVHFLDVDYGDRLQRDYLPALMTNEDYPHLIAPRETVSTIAVSNVLAYYNSRPSPDRTKRVNHFTDKLFTAIDALKQAAGAARSPLHNKWREINVYAPVAGWQRFPAAQVWIAKNPPSNRAPATATNEAASRATEAIHSATPATSSLQTSASDQNTTSGGGADTAASASFQQGTVAPQQDRRELFNQFLQWYDGAQKEQPAAH
jgi:uncharacterized protein